MSDWRKAYERLYATLVQAQSRRIDLRDISSNGQPAWIEYEREAMHAEVTRLRAQRGWGPVSIDRVLAKENLACGHIDYTQKYALGCADLVIDE